MKFQEKSEHFPQQEKRSKSVLMLDSFEQVDNICGSTEETVPSTKSKGIIIVELLKQARHKICNIFFLAPFITN